jgi:hypothetical protein
MEAVMAGTQGFAETVEEFRLPDSLRGSAWMAYRDTRTGICGTSLLHGFLPFLKAGYCQNLNTENTEKLSIFRKFKKL